MPFGEIGTLTRSDAAPLAFERLAGRMPRVVWLSGFKSDMAGTKAEALAAWAHAAGQAFVRFDYSGHGRSGGDFEACTIGTWRRDVADMLDAAGPGPIVLVGSSMGGWLSLLAAIDRPDRIAGMVLIAPAADFTERLMRPGLPPEARAALAASGRWQRPSAYADGPYVITRKLIEEGAAHTVLDRSIPFSGPVRILQGQQDPDVPWRHALVTAAAIAGPDVVTTLIKDGDHRLSRPQDIERLIETTAQLVGSLSA